MEGFKAARIESLCLVEFYNNFRNRIEALLAAVTEDFFPPMLAMLAARRFGGVDRAPMMLIVLCVVWGTSTLGTGEVQINIAAIIAAYQTALCIAITHSLLIL